MTLQRAAAVCAAVAVLLVTPATMWAQNQPSSSPAPVVTKDSLTVEQQLRYKASVRKGKAAWASGNYEIASRALNEAYGILPEPTLLFTLALIAEKREALTDARDYYRAYLAAPGITAQNRQRASDRLVKVQARIAVAAASAPALQGPTTVSP